MLDSLKVRSDKEGDGHYGSPRTHGKHEGVDYLVSEFDSIYAPEDGILVRKAYPYKDDLKYKGLFFRGKSGLEYKVFYANPNTSLINTQIKEGDKIAEAQDISKKYGLLGMKPHIHVEVFENGKHINPLDVIKSVGDKKILVAAGIILGLTAIGYALHKISK